MQYQGPEYMTVSRLMEKGNGKENQGSRMQDKGSKVDDLESRMINRGSRVEKRTCQRGCSSG
jgi:hypothetical protein